MRSHGGNGTTFYPFVVGLIFGILLSIALRRLAASQQPQQQQQFECKHSNNNNNNNVDLSSSTSPTTTTNRMDLTPNKYFQGQIESLDEILSPPLLSDNFDTGQVSQTKNESPSSSSTTTTTLTNDNSKKVIRPTKLLLVGVMTAQKYLDSRAVGVYNTWAQDIPGQIIFFVGGGSQTTDHTRRIHPRNFTLVSLAGVDDFSYPPQKKSFLMLKYMYDNYGDSYEWFMRADDDVYIKGDKLAEFLRSINSRQLYFIGQAGKGNREEFGTLNLANNENFCMGGPGIILSRAAMIKVAPNVNECLEDMYSTHEDVELGRCVQHFAGISCTWAYEMQSIFYHNSSGNEAFTYNLNQREVHRGITLHPVKDYRHMYRLHAYIQELKIKDLLYESIQIHRELLSLSSRNLTMSNEYLQDFKFDKNILEHIDVYGIQPSLNKYQPRAESNILSWDFLGKGVFSGDTLNPKQKIGTTLKESLEDVVHDMMDVINGFSRVRGRIIDFNKILWGYYRLNPLYGEDYVLDLHMTYKKYRGRKMTVPVRRHMYVQRPFAPFQLRLINPIVDDKIDSSHSFQPKKLILILPLSGRFKAFERFLKSFHKTCSTWNEMSQTELQLLIVYFPKLSPDEEGKSSDFFSLIHNFRQQTLAFTSCQIKIIQVGGEFSRSIALETGISKCRDNDLLFLIDVDIKFSPATLQRVVSNTVAGSQVYFPIVFSQFSPKLLDDVSNDNDDIVISDEKGYWREYGFGIAAFFKSDFRQSGGFDTSIHGWGKEDVFLYEQFISQTNLTIFRAPDPELVHIYHDINCDDSLSPAQYEMCVGTKVNTLGSVKTLIKYIFKHRPSSNVKRFLQAASAD